MAEKAQEIVDVVAKVIPDGGTALARQHGMEALAKAQELEAAVAEAAKAQPLYESVWQQFQTAPQQQRPMLIGMIQTIEQSDPALAKRLDALLAAYQEASRDSTRINTGGGAYIGGDVQTSGGGFVGRDSINITGDGNVMGDHSRATVIKQQGMDASAVAQAFEDFYAKIAQEQDLAPEDKADVRAELEDVAAELQKGEAADESFIRRRLRNVKRMAPDIFEVVVATFANPVKGLGLVAKKIADKMKAEAGAS